MISPGLTFVTTADGSQTIFNPTVGEHYHSQHGAVQESNHVFLRSGLMHYITDIPATSLNILEVGFGTGLNFLLSANFCTLDQLHLFYTGIEAFPLPPDMIGKTGYQEYVSASVWSDLQANYKMAFHQPVQINPYCQLSIAHSNLLGFQTEKKYDVIYFDAFAAVHQPEMWNEQAIAHTVSFMKPGSIFVTYAITGNLKRILKGLGLKVEKAPGAPGKREMLRAVL